MSCEFINGILPAADMRRFAVGQSALTPLWVAGSNKNGQSGWQGEVIIGTVVDVQDEYDPAPDAEVVSWQTIVVEAKVPGKTESYRLERTSYTAVPLPRTK